MQFTPLSCDRLHGRRRGTDRQGRKESGEKGGRRVEKGRERQRERERERERTRMDESKGGSDRARERASERRQREREREEKEEEEVEHVHGNTRTYTRSGALSSVPSAPSDVGQCSRLRRSRELLIKTRCSGHRSLSRRDDPHR